MNKFGSCSRCRKQIFYEPVQKPIVRGMGELIVEAQAQTVWGFAHPNFHETYTNGGYGMHEDKCERKDFCLCMECGEKLLKFLKGGDIDG